MTGYPWSQGDALLAADLNAAIANSAAYGPFLPLSGGTVTGPTMFYGPNPPLRLGGATGNYRTMSWDSSGISRFQFGLDPSDNFVMTSFDTGGGVLHGGLLSIDPATGTVTVNTSIATGAATVLSGTQQASQIKLNVVNQYSGTAAGDVSFVRFLTNNDTVARDASGGVVGVAAVDISRNWGGAGTTGARTGLGITQTQVAASSNKAAGQNPVHCGMILNNAVSFNEGGTGLTYPTAWGNFTGVGIQTAAYAGATNLSGICGMEIDIGMTTGASAVSKKGLILAKWSSDAVQSPIDDCALFIADQSGATVGWVQGIQFGSAFGQWSIDTTKGALIRGKISAGYAVGPTSSRFGLDLGQVGFPVFSTAARGGLIASNGFGVDGIGAVQIGTAYLTPSSTGAAIDCKGLVGSGTPSVAAGGAGYVVGDILFDAWGGIYRVATVSAGAVATITVYADSYGNSHQPYYPTAAAPANPVATTTWEGGIGTGCTLNLTWNTTAIGLSLNPTGQRLGFNSTSPIAKPTGWGAPTGTATRSTFVTGSVTLATLAEHVKALIDDLTSYGLIGP